MMTAIQNFDASVLLYIQDYLRTPFWNTFFVIFSRLGDSGILWIALGLALLFPEKTRRRGFDVLLCLAFAFFVSDLLIKPIVARPRPYMTIEGLQILVAPPTSYSFPSGHTNSSFAAALALTLAFGKKGAWAYVFAALIAFSRLWVGVHYPTDVICGALGGTLWVWIAWTLSHKYISPAFLAPHEEE